MIKNDLVSFLKSSSPLYYPMLTPFVSFISLCASFQVVFIHFSGTLTLIYIDHLRILKSSISPTPKRGGITCQSDPKYASLHGNWTSLDPYIGSIGSKTRIYKETHTLHARKSHLMRVTWIFRPSLKKASLLIASLSLLSIMFNYIQLIHRGSWFLIRVHHSSIDYFSSHH